MKQFKISRSTWIQVRDDIELIKSPKKLWTDNNIINILFYKKSGSDKFEQLLLSHELRSLK